MRSPYDRYHFDRDDAAISASAKRGELLFHSRPLSCFTCHGGVHFSESIGGVPGGRPAFHNTGCCKISPACSRIQADDTGLQQRTGALTDVGRFKAPTLRNIAVTAPYMHDGSLATLDDVIAHYEAGGRAIAEGPQRGVGHDNPNEACAASASPTASGPICAHSWSRSPTRRC